MAENKKGVKDYLDALVDNEGIKTDVTVTLTNDSLIKLIAGIVIAGAGVLFMRHLMKDLFPDKYQVKSIQLLTEIKEGVRK